MLLAGSNQIKVLSKVSSISISTFIHELAFGSKHLAQLLNSFLKNKNLAELLNAFHQEVWQRLEWRPARQCGSVAGAGVLVGQDPAGGGLLGHAAYPAQRISGGEHRHVGGGSAAPDADARGVAVATEPYSRLYPPHRPPHAALAGILCAG